MKRGFTLIELVVTIAVSGIFFTLAMNLYTQAVKGQITFTKKDAAYMQRSVNIAKTKRILQEHPGKCINGIYVLDSADNVNPVTSFVMQANTHNVISTFEETSPTTSQPLQCKKLKRGKIVVYGNFGSYIVRQ